MREYPAFFISALWMAARTTIERAGSHRGESQLPSWWNRTPTMVGNRHRRNRWLSKPWNEAKI